MIWYLKADWYQYSCSTTASSAGPQFTADQGGSSTNLLSKKAPTGWSWPQYIIDSSQNTNVVEIKTNIHADTNATIKLVKEGADRLELTPLYHQRFIQRFQQLVTPSLPVVTIVIQWFAGQGPSPSDGAKSFSQLPTHHLWFVGHQDCLWGGERVK